MFITKAKSKLISVVTALAVISSPASADNLARWIDVENVGSSGIVGIYISNVDDDAWSRNLIRGNYIPAGDTMTVEPRRPNGYCRFDMLIEYEDGEELTVWDVNLCEETDIAVNENRYYI